MAAGLRELEGGLDRQVASWLGNGANMAVSPEQLRSALGDGRLQQIGDSAGVFSTSSLGDGNVGADILRRFTVVLDYAK